MEDIFQVTGILVKHQSDDFLMEIESCVMILVYTSAAYTVSPTRIMSHSPSKTPKCAPRIAAFDINFVTSLSPTGRFNLKIATFIKFP